MTCLEILANTVHAHQLYNCSRTARRTIRQTDNTALMYLQCSAERVQTKISYLYSKNNINIVKQCDVLQYG